MFRRDAASRRKFFARATLRVAGTSALVALSTLLLTPARSQEFIQNGGFENLTAQQAGVIYCEADSWVSVGTCGGGTPNYAYLLNQGSQRSGMGFLIIANPINGPATISQTVSLQSGFYTFSFWYSTINPGPGATFTARVGSNAFVFAVGTVATAYQQFSQQLTLSGSTTISFENTSGTVWSVGIDDVSLVLDQLAPTGPTELSSSLPANAPPDVRGVAAAIDRFVAAGGALPPGFNGLFNLSPEQLVAALTQLSGQGGNGSVQTTSYAAASQFINTIMDPSIDGRGGDSGAIPYADEAGNAYAAERKLTAAERAAYKAVTPHERIAIGGRWSVWASGYGGTSSVSGNATAGTQSTTSRIYGTAVGADYRVGRDTLVGFAMGGAGTSFNTAQGLGGGRADLFQAGVYGRHWFGAAYVAGALVYSWQDVTVDRTVTVAGLDSLRANFDTNTFAARAEGGYRFAVVGAGLTPYGALQATTFRLPGYSEMAVFGSNQFALTYASEKQTNVRTELGLRADRSFLVHDGMLTLRGRAAWAHDSNTDRVITPTFQSLPGAGSFAVNGAKPAADGALVTAGAEMKWRNGWALAGTFDGEFSKTTESYLGKGSVRYTW